MRNNAQVGITSKDKATQFTVEWRPGKDHKIEFDFIKKSYDENANVTGRFLSYTNNAYLVGIESRWGGLWRTVAQVVKSGAGSCTRVNAACSTDGLEGSKFIVDTLTKLLQLDPARVALAIEDCGNTVSSSIPLILARELTKPEIRRIVLCGFGAGLSWSSALLTRITTV